MMILGLLIVAALFYQLRFGSGASRSVHGDDGKRPVPKSDPAGEGKSDATGTRRPVPEPAELEVVIQAGEQSVTMDLATAVAYVGKAPEGAAGQGSQRRARRAGRSGQGPRHAS